MKRRTILSGTALALPYVWTRPVVDTVLLPAHAQTSEPPEEPPKDDPPKDEPPQDDPPKEEPPKECVTTLYRIKSKGTNGWESDPGVGAKDCLSSGENTDGSWFATLSGDTRKVVVTVNSECTIKQAAHKAGQTCVPAKVSGQVATFTAEKHDISHVELVLECCEEVK